MSRSRNGKRWRTVRLRPESSKLKEPIFSRHMWEKILRRNRKLWTRLLGKRRRAQGRRLIQEQLRN